MHNLHSALAPTSALSVLNDTANLNAKAIYQNGQMENVRSLEAASVRINVVLTAVEEEWLARAIYPLSYRYNRNIVSMSHGLAHELNRLAYEDVINTANKFIAAGLRVIDIGGTNLRTPLGTHICTLIDNCRNNARYVNAAAFKIDTPDERFRELIATTTSHPDTCTEGAHNCYVKARYAYMVNVYDISMEQIVEIFSKHDLLVLDAYMFIPDCLLQPELNADQTVYRVADDHNGKTFFSLNDSCNMYTHDTKIWRSYARTTKIECPDGAIVVEVIKEYWTFKKIRFTRTENTLGVPTRNFPFNKYYNKTFIPDMVYYQNNKFTSDFKKKGYLIPTTFVRQVMDWALCQKAENFTSTSFFSYARVFTHTVTATGASNYVLQYEGLNLDSETTVTVFTSLFIIACIQRWRSTNSIVQTLNHLSDSDPNKHYHVLINLKHMLRFITSRIDGAINGLFDRTLQDLDGLKEEMMNPTQIKYSERYVAFANFIYHVRLTPVSGHIVNDVHKSEKTLKATKIPILTKPITGIYKYAPVVTPPTLHTFSATKCHRMKASGARVCEVVMPKSTLCAHDSVGPAMFFEPYERPVCSHRRARSMGDPTYTGAEWLKASTRSVKQGDVRTETPCADPPAKTGDKPKDNECDAKKKNAPGTPKDAANNGAVPKTLIFMNGRTNEPSLVKNNKESAPTEKDAKNRGNDDQSAGSNKEKKPSNGDEKQAKRSSFDKGGYRIISPAEASFSGALNTAMQQLPLTPLTEVPLRHVLVVAKVHSVLMTEKGYEIMVENAKFDRCVTFYIINHGKGRSSVCESKGGDMPLTTITSVHQCGAPVYDPSPAGDGVNAGKSGMCGYNALREFARRKNIKFDDFEALSYASENEMARIAFNMRFNLIIHRNYDYERTFYFGHKETAKINLSNNHWTLLHCDCTPKQQICDYASVANLPAAFTAKNLYVNCAGRYLKDGAGQAKSFREAFPTYKEQLKKMGHVVDGALVKDVLTEIEHGDGTTHIAVVVAHKITSNDDTDQMRAHARLFEICEEIYAYANLNNLVVFMPYVGCGLFRNDISCLRSALMAAAEKYPNVKVSFVSDNKNDHQRCRNAPQCSHGGYKVTGVVPKNCVNGDEEEYIPITKIHDKEKMQGKYAEIIAYIRENVSEKSNVTELSAAPGGFVRAHHSNNAKFLYSFLLYDDPKNGSFPFKDLLTWYNRARPKNAKCLGIYRDFEAVINKIPKEDVLVFDSVASALLPHLLTLARKQHVITKISYDQREILGRLAANNAVTTFRLESSELKSSELYVHIAPHPPFNSGVLHFGEVFTQSNRVINTCYEKLRCQCTYDFKSNTVIRIRAFSEEELNDFAVKNELKKVTGDIDAFEFEAITGVPGSGKTMGINAATCPKCTLHAAPFRELATQPGYCTYVNACKYDKAYKVVHLDEIYAWPKVHIAYLRKMQQGARFVGTGDPYQIRARCYNGEERIEDCDYDCKQFLTKSSRVHKDIAARFNGYLTEIGGMQGHEREGGISTINNFEELEKQVSRKTKQAIIVNTQSDKEKYLSLATKHQRPILTANECMGKTYTDVIYIASGVDQLPEDRVAYVYTAMSRASSHLVVYGDDQEIQRIFTILGSPVERAMEMFDNIPIETHIIEPVKTKNVKHYKPPGKVDADSVVQASCDVLDRIFIPLNGNNVHDIIGYKNDILPYKENNKQMKTTLETLLNDDTRLNGRKFSNKMYGQYHYPKNTKKMYDTAVMRYCKKHKKIPQNLQSAYMDGFNTWMKPNWIKNMSKEITPEIIAKNTYAYICELQKKFVQKEELNQYRDDATLLSIIAKSSIDESDHQLLKRYEAVQGGGYLTTEVIHIIRALVNGESNKVADLEHEIDDSYHNTVQFHLKRQPKSINGIAYEIKEKAGQGISAWSKLLNVVMSGMTRTYDELIRKYVKDNVNLSYGKSDADIAEFTNDYAKQLNSKSYLKVMADFSEFDSSQEEQGILASIEILRQLGFNEKVLGKYLEMREKWKLVSATDSSFVMVMCNWMQSSGQAFTLAGNTQHNMIVMGAAYIYKNIVFAMFKGDDSLIVCEGIREAKIEGVLFTEHVGYKIKIHEVDIAEYIANIVTPHGWFPDVIRRVTRVLTKIYTTKDDWLEIRKSMSDALDVIDPENRHLGCYAASRFYQQFGIIITPNEVNTLVDFLVYMTTKNDISELQLRGWDLQYVNYDTVKAYN
nr:nonstructural polyprotein [Hepelivirales sp.]